MPGMPAEHKNRAPSSGSVLRGFDEQRVAIARLDQLDSSVLNTNADNGAIHRATNGPHRAANVGDPGPADVNDLAAQPPQRRPAVWFMVPKLTMRGSIPLARTT